MSGSATRSIDLSRFLTARTQGILQRAGRFALERGQTELDALHILRVIVEDDSVKQAIARIGVAPSASSRRRRHGCPRHPRPASTSSTSGERGHDHAEREPRAVPRVPGRGIRPPPMLDEIEKAIGLLSA